MKNKSSRLGLLCVALAIAGVAGLQGGYPIFPPATAHPVGERPHALTPADWVGTWIAGHDVMTVTVTDAEKGRLQVSSIGTHDGKPTLETRVAEIREFGTSLFLTLTLDEGLRFWARIKVQGDLVLVWEPTAEGLMALGRAGKLQCRVEEGGHLLDPLSPKDLNVLTSELAGEIFRWKSPLILRRLKRPRSPRRRSLP